MRKIKYILSIIIIFIFSISIYGYEKMALMLQNSFGAYKEIKIADFIIQRPEDWLLYYSKPSRESRVRLYGIFPFNLKKDSIPHVHYAFLNLSKDNDGSIFFIEMTDLDLKNRLWVMENFESKRDPRWSMMNFSGRKALLFYEKDNFPAYSISIPSLRLNIKTTSLDLLEPIAD